MVEVMRLKERIGGFHKYVDNACINQPDPTSSHYMSEAERFDKDFSVHDKKMRAYEHQQKQEMIEKKRYPSITLESKSSRETCLDGSLWTIKKKWIKPEFSTWSSTTTPAKRTKEEQRTTLFILATTSPTRETD